MRTLRASPLQRALRAVALTLGLATLATPGRAAGGHHDVDDAVVLEPGHCQVENWVMDWKVPRLNVAHIGPACRWGDIEWALNADRYTDARGRVDIVGPGWKATQDLLPQKLAIGAALNLGWRTKGERRTIVSAYVPVTAWLADGRVQLHLNAGADHDPASGRHKRLGAAVDAALDERWTLTVERRAQYSATLTRAGIRYNFTPLISLDLSQAQGSGQRVAVLGLTVEWER